MKVTLLNPEELKNIFKEWGTFAATGAVTFPITFPTALLSLSIGSASSTLSYYSASAASGFTVAGGSAGKYIAIGY